LLALALFVRFLQNWAFFARMHPDSSIQQSRQYHILCHHKGGERMPKAQRERRERTDNYHLILQWCRSPEQRLYEGIRPITLFGIPPAERAEETGVAESTLRRAAAAFDTHGMISLFRPTKAQREDHHRSRPFPMRQLIVDRKRRVCRFYSWRDRRHLRYPVRRASSEPSYGESGSGRWPTAFADESAIPAL
jgi:hypothetical protein